MCVREIASVKNRKLAIDTSLPQLVQIVLNTSKEVGNLQKVLWNIYSSLYCEYIVKNPLYDIGEPFE